ncbi:hypothetical protein [Fulvivirga lutea]|uniref:Uncharacterized protein n=1 Tax=Fulvivirga lutea TaxID=2810512 RepID=A0A974ZZT1_9BACT|nr:hypothetical protein [Fulvivirga lutea]QSE96486.1 hypothetical protein JR347_12855 [Fulvivirga lutea]
MKTAEIIFGIFFTAAIFGPLFYLYHWSNRRKTKMVNALQSLAKIHSLQLSEKEVWNDKGLGYDISKKSLIYIAIQNQIVTEKYISILDVHEIKIITNRDVVTIQFLKHNREAINLEIFNTLFDEPLNGGYHLLLAKKWVDLLNKDIKTLPKKAA